MKLSSYRANPKPLTFTRCSSLVAFSPHHYSKFTPSTLIRRIFQTCYTLPMKLSPLDIQHQEFDTAMSGYKKKQVREFLERVADAFEELLRDNQDLHNELEGRDERIEELQVGELELRRAVVSAERIGNELKEQAQREAELTIQEGRAQRDDLLRDAEAQLHNLKAELERTRREHKLFREQFRGMLRAYERSLDAQPEPVQENTSRDVRRSTPESEGVPD